MALIDPFPKRPSLAQPPANTGQSALVDPFPRRPSRMDRVMQSLPAAPVAAQTPAPGRSLGEKITDSAIGLAQGTVNQGAGFAQAFNVASDGALDRFVVKPAQRAVDRALGGRGDAPGLAGGIAAFNQAMEPGKSEALRQDYQALDEADGFWDAAGTVIRRPRLMGQMLIEQVPNLLTLGIGAAGTAARAGAAAIARGATDDVAAAAGRQAAERGLVGANAAMSGGFAAQEAMQSALETPDEVWDRNPEFVALAQQVGRDEAKQQLALRAGQYAGAVAAPLGAAGAKITAPFETGVFTRSLQAGGARGLATAVGKEAAEELVQEGGEQFGANVGLRGAVDAQQDLFEGVPEAMGIGSTVGGVLGGGMYAGGRLATRRRESRARAAIEAAADRAGTAAREAGVVPPEGPVQPQPEPQAAPPVDPAAVGAARSEFSRRMSALEQAQGKGGTNSRVRARVATEVARDFPGLTPADILADAPQPPQPGTAAAQAPAVPFPDAQPGTLADAANSLPAAAPVAQEPMAQSAEAAPEVEPAPAVRPALPLSPWMDPESGVARNPTDDEIRAQFNRMFDARKAGIGETVPRTAQLARDWGVNGGRLRDLRAQVVAERKRPPGPAPQPDTPIAPPQGGERAAVAAQEDSRDAAPGAGSVPDQPGLALGRDTRGSERAQGQDRPDAGAAPAGDRGEPATAPGPAAADPGADVAAAGPAAPAPAVRSGLGAAAAPAAPGDPAPAGAATAGGAGDGVAGGGAAAAIEPVDATVDTPAAAAPGAPPAAPDAAPPAGPVGADGRAIAAGMRQQAQQQAAAAPSKVEAAAAEAATSPANDLPEPTPAQRQAGNFKMGHTRLHGLEVTVQWPAGARRRPRHRKLAHPYGHIRRTEGSDGDQLDVYLGPRAEDPAAPVFVVDQAKADGSFDEHKVMLGFASEAEARKGYLDNYPKGWNRLRGLRQMTTDEFKAWARDPEATKRPAAGDAPAGATPTETAPQAEPAAGATPPAPPATTEETTDEGQDQQQEAVRAEGREQGAAADEGTARVPAGQEGGAGAVADEATRYPIDPVTGARIAPDPDDSPPKLPDAPEGLNAPPPPPDELRQHAFDVLEAEIGWLTVGGRLLRSHDDNRFGTGEVVGRTKWEPRGNPFGEESEFWRNRPRINEAQARDAFARVRSGQKLSPTQERFIAYARAVADDYAARHMEDEARAKAEIEDAAESERQAALAELRALGAQFDEADADEALSLADLVLRARDAGVSDAQIDTVFSTYTSPATQAYGLWLEITLHQESRRGNDAGTEAERGEGGAEAGRQEGSGDPQQAAGGASAVGQSAQKVAAPPRAAAGLFPPPTAQETLSAERQRRQDATDGRGKDAPSMAGGAGELFAGPRPVQVDIESAGAEQEAAKADKPSAGKARNTEDAGEELWYNRRNRGGKGLVWDDIAGLNLTLQAREAVKSKVWPRPDYEQLVTDGMPAPIAHLVKQVYDSLAARPRIGKAEAKHLQDYVDAVARTRDAVFEFARRLARTPTPTMPDKPPADLRGRVELENRWSEWLRTADKGGAATLLDTLFPVPGDAPRHNRFRGNPANNALAHLMGGNKFVRALQPGWSDLSSALQAVREGWPAPREAWERSYEIRDKGGEFTVTKLRRSAVLAGPFKTRDEAVEAARGLVSATRKRGTAEAEAPVDLQGAREGVARRRADQDVTSDELKEAFGFKGVNFGDWMKGNSPAKVAERQAHLNHAYDSFMDLAELIGVPPRALSLDGMLGIAFGAQGKGAAGGGAAAHFVPGVNEINLTRENGAGSLAHEWGHALDHHFGVQGGKAGTLKPYITNFIGNSGLPGVRPEVGAAFLDVLSAMRQRMETPAEAAARVEAGHARSRRALDGWLRHLRVDLASGLERTSKDPAPLAEFDQLADRLRAGDLGEGYVRLGRSAASEQPQTVAQIALLMKDAIGARPGPSVESLSAAAGSVAYYAKQRDEAAGHVPQPITVTSNFLAEAKKLDGGRKEPYWTTPWELFARAFQSYVLDRLAQRSIRNDYLTRPQMDEATLKVAQDMGLGEDGDRYPRGVERERINAAFDTLFQAIETRESESGNPVLFDLAQDPVATGAEFAAIEKAVKEATQGWSANAPRITVVRTPADLPAAARRDPRHVRSRGVNMRDGRVFIVASNMPTDRREAIAQALRTVAHEAIGHHGVDAIIDQFMPGGWGRLTADIARLRQNPDQAAASIRPLLAEVEERYSRPGRPVGDQEFARELVAVMAERGMRNGLVGRVVAAVRAFLRRFAPGLRISDAEIRALLARADTWLRATPAQSGADARALVEAWSLSLEDGSREVPIVEVAPRFGDVAGDPAAARQRARQWLAGLRAAGTTFRNAQTGWDIGLSAAGNRELVTWTGDPTKLHVLGALPQIMEGAVLAVSSQAPASDTGTRAWHTFYAPIKVGSEVRIARAVVRESPDRRFVYDMQQSGILAQEGPASAAHTGPATKAGGRRPQTTRPTMTLAELRAAVNADPREAWVWDQAAASGRPFYSALSRSITEGRGAPRKAKAAQWKQWLDGAQRRGEFRQAERDWLGVDAWLDGQGAEVTREAVAEFVRGNEVEVREVVLGGERVATPDMLAWEEARDSFLDGEEATFWSIDGDSEKVFVLNGEGPDADWFVLYQDRIVADGLPSMAAAKTAAFGVVAGRMIADTTRFGGWRVPGGGDYREMALVLPHRPGTDAFTVPESHSMGREADTNRVAHVRFDERADAAGKRVLFLHEIQSDWHQAGRKRGYKGPISADVPMKAKLWDNGIVWEVSTADGEFITNVSPSDFGGTESDPIWSITEEQAIEVARRRVREQPQLTANAHRVPDAPFKATDEWAMLAFKRMARWAAENGYDRIAWATGEQVADVFDLSKQIDALRVVEDGPGQYRVMAKKGGQMVLDQEATEAELPGIVGKEMAERALADIEKAKNPGAGKPARQSAEYSGLDLRLGGEGMRGFYDKILPSAVGKWGKKWGAKVGTADLPMAGEFETVDGELVQRTLTAHAIDVTPELREAALDGMPLFDLQPDSTGKGAAQSIDRLTEVLGAGDTSAWNKAKAWAAGKFEDAKAPLLGALQLRHLIELATDGKNPLLPLLKPWANTVQQMATDRQGYMDEVGLMADQWRDWAHGPGFLSSFRKPRAQAQALHALMHEATQLGVDPSKPYEPLTIVDKAGRSTELTQKAVRERVAAINAQIRTRPGDNTQHLRDEIKYVRGLMARERARKAAYPRLQARFQALAEGEKDMTMVVGADGRVLSVHAKPADATKAQAEHQGATLATAPAPHALWRSVRDHYTRHQERTEAALLDRIKDLVLPQEAKASLRERIRYQFERNRVDGVYFPLSRTGDYWLHADVPAGEGKTEGVFAMFETAAELRAAEKGLRARGAKDIRTGLRDGAGSARDAVPGTFAADVVGMLQKAGAPDTVQDQVWQLFMRTLPEMSMRKHQIHRKNVPGFDPDALRAFAKNGFHGAHQLARLRWSHVLQNDLEQQEKQIDARRRDGSLDTAESVAADRILNEVKRRHDFIMSPKDAAWANRITGFGFAWYLGATPAAALVNLTQGAQATYPVLGAKYGWGRAGRALASATAASAKTLGNIERTALSDEERMAYRAMREAGWIEKTQMHSLAGLAEGDQLQQSPAWQRSMQIIGAMFQRMEVVNREAAGIAAFRLARAGAPGVPPMDFGRAVKYAGEIINGTHFDYSAANRPRFMQNNVAKILLQFRNYSVGMTWLFWRGVHQAIRGETPEVRRLARRQTAGILGMTGLLAGAMGLPVMNLVKWTMMAAHAAFGDDEEPMDPETEIYAAMSDWIGPEAARYVLKGPTSMLTGADVASRVGLADLWWREPDRDLDGQGAYYHLLEQVAGPMGGFFKGLFVGADRLNDGDPMRALESMLPKAVKDGLKALRYGDEGATSWRGDPIMEDVSLPMQFTQAIGFTPTRLAEQYRENSALKNYETWILDRRASLMNAFAKALADQDEPTRQQVMERIARFNSTYPEIAISGATLRRSLQARARFSAQAENGVVLNRKIADRLRERVGAE